MKRIEEFTNDELLNELRRRCSPFIFMGYRIEEGGIQKHWFDWWGSDAVCYGLCHSLAFYIQQQMVNDEVNHVEGN